MENTLNSWCVYKHISPDGKVYIGSCKNIKHRWRGDGNGYKGCTRFYDAICQIGWDKFKHEVIAQGMSQLDAHKLEQRMIHDLKATDELYGYNMQSGGVVGKHHSDETKRKMSEAAKRRYENQEERDLQSARIKLKYKDSEYKESVQNAVKKARARAVKCVETDEVFASATEAAKITGIKRSSISGVCSGKRKTTHGRHWKYADI